MAAEPDIAVERFCPRCNTVTVWDSPGVETLECTNFRPDEPSHCGFTLATELSVVEQERFDAYARWLDPPRPRSNYQHV